MIPQSPVILAEPDRYRAQSQIWATTFFTWATAAERNTAAAARARPSNDRLQAALRDVREAIAEKLRDWEVPGMEN